MIPSNLNHYSTLSYLAPGITSYLEVGVQEGGSLSTVIKAAGSSLTSLLLSDTWDKRHGGSNRGSHEHIDKLLESIEFDGEVTYADGRSQVTLPKFNLSDHQYDLTHVDGGHDLAEVKADLDNVWLLTRHRMVVHDTSFPNVWDAICTFGYTHSNARVIAISFEDQGTISFQRMEGWI